MEWRKTTTLSLLPTSVNLVPDQLGPYVRIGHLPEPALRPLSVLLPYQVSQVRASAARVVLRLSDLQVPQQPHLTPALSVHRPRP